MSIENSELLLRYPPRPLTPKERDLVDGWLSLAGDVAIAYASERRTDDPAMYRRVVIAAGAGDQPTHLVSCPDGMRLWVKLTVGAHPRVEIFDTLRAALNSIRYVLLEGERDHRTAAIVARGRRDGGTA